MIVPTRSETAVLHNRQLVKFHILRLLKITHRRRRLPGREMDMVEMYKVAISSSGGVTGVHVGQEYFSKEELYQEEFVPFLDLIVPIYK